MKTLKLVFLFLLASVSARALVYNELLLDYAQAVSLNDLQSSSISTARSEFDYQFSHLGMSGQLQKNSIESIYSQFGTNAFLHTKKFYNLQVGIGAGSYGVNLNELNYSITESLVLGSLTYCDNNLLARVYLGNELVQIEGQKKLNLIVPVSIYGLYEDTPFVASNLAFAISVELLPNFESLIHYEVFTNSYQLGIRFNYKKLKLGLSFAIPRAESLSQVQLSLRYSFQSKKIKLRRSVKRERLMEEKVDDKFKYPKRKRIIRRKKIVPNFKTLVKWGLNPMQALLISRAKDICRGNRASRLKLARHNWHCHTKSIAKHKVKSEKSIKTW